MQSMSQQAAVGHTATEIEPAMPSRPAPFVPARVTLKREAVFTGSAGSGATVREQLAASFHKAGQGVKAQTAFARVKSFYRSAGHAWTRALSRDTY